MMEKIIASHTTEEVAPGNIVWLDIDVRSARDFAGANVVKNFQKHYGQDQVHDVAKTFFTFDCNVPANNIPYANNQHICRTFAREKGIKVYDVDAGIGSHVMIDEGLALPGTTVVGTDSHLNIMGAIGSFGQGMGDQDIAFVFRAGKTWFEVPESMKIEIKGKLPADCTAKDLTLFILGKMGAAGALGKAVEYYGEAVQNLDLAGRITLASMGTEMGAIICFIPPDEKIISFCTEKAAVSGKSFEPVVADADATYVASLCFDISSLEPMISLPPNPEKVAPVSSLPETRIDSVLIGSCTNGTYEDLALAATIARGRKVAPGVMAKIVPATRKVYSRLMEEGHLTSLFEAGFIISHPGCGGCASGQLGMTGKGEVQVSTSNRNFAGKQGDGQTYLASTATAAASAILGRIGSIRDLEVVS